MISGSVVLESLDILYYLSRTNINFFLQLQQLTGIRLYEKESVIIFDDERVIIGTS